MREKTEESWPRKTRCHDHSEHRFSHRDIINASEIRIKFLIKLVYDLLPTPANKSKWFGEDDICNLCNERGTLNHILSGCKMALSQGRYTW